MIPGLPVAIVGAGPIGLAAAAHLHHRGIDFILFEQGPEVGHAILQWGHVRLFSTWRDNIDAACSELLLEAGWSMPDPEVLPTGRELVDRYLAPLARDTRLASSISCGEAVTAIGRAGLDLARSAERESTPFALRLASGRLIKAAAVIDASGAWFHPNPLGAGGYPLPGEAGSPVIEYGLPDVAGDAQDRYRARRVLVVGSGHSAMNVVRDLAALNRQTGVGAVHWAISAEKHSSLMAGAGRNAMCGAAADPLAARLQLELEAAALLASGQVQARPGFRAEGLGAVAGGIAVTGRGAAGPDSLVVDRVVVATGFRPDHSLAREIRIALDPRLEAVETLAPLIDPDLHSCTTVPRHGWRDLAHPEADFFVVGWKSYGRAPTFLMATGYRQVRSVAAALAGDLEAADADLA